MIPNPLPSQILLFSLFLREKKSKTPDSKSIYPKTPKLVFQVSPKPLFLERSPHNKLNGRK